MIRAAEGRATGPGLRVAVVTLGMEAGVARASREVARRLAARVDVAAVVERGVLDRRGPRRDPFELERRVGELDADAVVAVAPARWGPRRVVPGAVVAGRPLGLVQADAAGDLPPAPDPDPWSGHGPGPEPGAPWVVAAMAKDIFLGPTEHWARTLDAAGRRTVDVRADRGRREELLAALRAGPGVVLYAGHGRTRGWSGYQGLRWRHLRPAPEAPPRPAGLVVAFACDTLKRSRSRVDFGTRMVTAGVARAYLGAAGSIRTADAEALAELFLRHLARWPVTGTLTGLLREVDRAAARDPSARRAWRSFRLLGDPAARLATGG